MNREEMRRLVSLPEMPEEDCKILVEAGRDPDDWITYAMLAEFWGTSKDMIRQLKCKAKIPMGIKLNNKVFLPAKCAYGPYLPKGVKKMFHEIRMSEMGNDDLESKGVSQTVVRHTGNINKTRKQVDYLKTLAQCVSLDDWQEVIQRALADAKEGDRHARKWLADYLVGTPIRRTATIVQHRHEKFSDEERSKLITRMILGMDDEEEEVDGDTSIIEGTYTDSQTSD